MPWYAYILATIFTLFGGACVASIILSLPGAWILIAVAFIIEFIDQWWLVPDALGRTQTFEWWLLWTCLGLAIVGELIELAAGAAARRAAAEASAACSARSSEASSARSR